MVTKKKTTPKSAVKPAAASDTTDIVAAELRKAREAKGVGLSDLHRLTKLSRTTLHQYEAGTRKPGTRELRLLCDALQVTPNRLIYGSEVPFKEGSRLHAMLNVTNEDLRTARLAILLQMLSKDERDAWVTLLAESLKARVKEDLPKVLDHVEEATKVLVTEVAQAFEGAMPTEMLEEVGRKIEASLSGKTKK